MKKAILIYAVLLMSSFSFATSKNEKVEIELKTITATEETVVNIQFGSFEEFDNYDFNKLSTSNDKEEGGTITVTVTVSVGSGSTYASVTITESGIKPSELSKKLKELKKSAQESLGN